MLGSLTVVTLHGSCFFGKLGLVVGSDPALEPMLRVLLEGELLWFCTSELSAVEHP